MNLVHEPFIETFTKIVNMCLYYNSRGAGMKKPNDHAEPTKVER